jgi:type VI secretion system secreted protein Hcp
MTVVGVTQGNISERAFTADSVGNTYQEGHEDEIYVLAVDSEVTIPTDPQSGQPRGQRSHKPFVVTKMFDKASPLLWQALCNGETLQISIDFYRTSTKGGQELYFTIKLTDAIVVDMKGYFKNPQLPENAHLGQLEDVSFVYRAIQWTHTVAGTSGQDDWRKPNMA